jgi:hypothetical protein
MRSIKPEMFRSFTVSAWPVAVRWTFAGLFTYLDDSGRGADDARLVKAEIYPIDDEMTGRKVEQHLAVIEKTGPLCRYQVDGRRYMHITSWEEHQRINRPTASRIPPCPTHESSQPPHGGLSEPSVSPNGALTEPSLPHAQASAPAEHGAREQGSREQGNARPRRSTTDERVRAGLELAAKYDRLDAAEPPLRALPGGAS